jgi:5'(3')-deoxyribonucleotidase
VPQNPASRPVVAIDIDEVLIPFMGSFLDYHNERYGTNYQLKLDMNYFGVHEMLGDSVKETQRKVDDFAESNNYRHGSPIEGAKDSIEKLKCHYDLVVVTARPASVRELTEAWVRNHFGETFKDVHFSDWLQDQVPDKAIVLRESGADVLIDDNLRHIREAVAIGLRGILFGDYPWNQAEELPTGVTRAKNWGAVEEILL